MSIKHFLEVALELVGFKPKLKSQPEVINPKTGKPFDLKDPQLPVVENPSFTVQYWAMPKTEPFAYKYLVERYEFFNKTRFGNKLTRPTIDVRASSPDALKLKNRGVWYPSQRRIFISLHLFKAPHEGWVNHILLHEMCHQYVTDLHDGDDGGKKSDKGHGPRWREAMVMVKLQPNRYDETPNFIYMTEREKRKHKHTIERRELFLKGYTLLKETRKPVTRPKIGDKVVFPDGVGQIVEGVIELKAPNGKTCDVTKPINQSSSLLYEGVPTAVLFYAE